MSTSNGSRVLAIGIDAAEPTFVRQLIEQNEMPALKSLLAEGKWLCVRSPSHIGSGAVWPTFITGEEPTAHGIYSEWRWRPEAMTLSRYNGRHLTPFWKPLAEQGVSVGVFDVPFALPVGLTQGFEVSDWWAHDSTGAGLQAGPGQIPSVVRQSPSHPLSANRFVNTTPDNHSNLNELASACIEGARLRGMLAQRLIRETNPQLSLFVFPEIHHAGHQLWHTIAPNHRIYSGREFSNGHAPASALKDVYRAVDHQIAGLIDAAGSAATVMVFALHGMRPALGFPGFLGPLLCEWGFSQPASLRLQSWTERALSLFAATKRHTPAGLKKLYYQLTPTTATHKLARPTMLPAYDWQNTRAFSLPTDQYGWIRVNLVGRETRGCVSLERYEETCRQLEGLLLGLTTTDGQSLVHDVLRTSADAERALSNPLPDLVVHWENSALETSMKIRDSNVQVQTVSRKSTGQHASDGFCILKGLKDGALGEVVAAKDMGSLIAEIVRKGSLAN